MKAVFLDRDGTLNDDPGYLGDPKQMKLLPGVGEALSKLHQAGFVLVVVSNQSGVGRGFFPVTALQPIHEKMNELLVPYKVRIKYFYLCLHKPEDKCACRKPKPFLLLKAAKELSLDLSQSYMVGDKTTDIEAGKNAGCKESLFVGPTPAPENCPCFPSLKEAADWILNQPTT